MEVLVGSNSRHGLRIEAHHRNLPNKGKLVLYVIHCFDCKSHLKQFYINNRAEHFSHKGGCGVTHIKAFKRTGLSYR